jgi:hypothetical protein
MPMCTNFYLGGTDHCGRTLNEIMKFTDFQWEHYHDFIQWVFPSDEVGMMSFAPIVTQEDVEQFNDPVIQKQLLEVFKRFLTFLGLSLSNDDDGNGNGSIIIVDYDKFYNRVQRPNHNQLRITRALRSLRLLGLQSSSTLLFNFLDKLNRDSGIFHSVTFQYWKKTQTLPAQVATGTPL